ncbi:GNAT family N-acetyltransferase [Lacticaseibacillus nasuensis]|uniref:GNAT family N-acetyltransferase n=1 Tax=Lacticaseibacillus nasuensis TaxID=944671 RepID=UPI0006CF760D|nr:GNAT family N-acetyltransferase [Lacticaseibacillus nasuensis]
MEYRFEQGLTIHEITALYGAVGWQHYLQDAAETARGIANSTLLTARDGEKLVGLIRGLSDMHTVVFIQDLLVLPEYQHQASAASCSASLTITSNKSAVSLPCAMTPRCMIFTLPLASSQIRRRTSPLTCGRAGCWSRNIKRNVAFNAAFFFVVK